MSEPKTKRPIEREEYMKNLVEVLTKLSEGGSTVIKIGEYFLLYHEADMFVPVDGTTGTATGEDPMTLQELANKFAGGDLDRLKKMPATIEMVSVQIDE